MKGYLKSAVILLSTGLYLQPSFLLAQESNNPSQKASDIQKTSPATVSGQETEGAYSQQNLCQIGKKLSKTAKSEKRNSMDSSTTAFNSPDGRKINKGIPLNTVLGSIAKEGNSKQSKGIKTEPRSNGCE